MLPESDLMSESLATGVALVARLQAVRLLVHLQFAVGLVGFRARVTGERTLLRVGLLVRSQVHFLKQKCGFFNHFLSFFFFNKKR